MSMKYGKEFKIGVFVVVVLTVTFFLINYLRGEDIFNNEIELSSRYENVQGLQPSAPVFIKGYKAGKVTEVRYDMETEDFEVTCSIRKEFRIPEDSRMTIYSVDIMGGKGVRIDLGTSDVAVADGAELNPSFEAGLMDGLSGSVAPLLAKVTSTLDSLSVTVSGVNRMLSEDNQAALAGTLAHLQSTMKNVEAISSGFAGKSDELTAFVENLSAFSARFSSIADNADSAIEDVASVAATISEADLSGLISSFKALLENINDPDGTIGKLLVDKSVYDSVDALLNDVDSLVRKIEENPKKYIRISVF